MKAIQYLGLLLVIIILPINPQEPPTPEQQEITPRMQKAIEKGIEWLIKNQNDDGSWGCEKGQPPSVALTSMAVLSLLAAGYSPTRGKYSEEIQKAIKFLKKIASKKEMLYAYDSTQMGAIFEHACGTLLLAHLYGMAGKKEDKTEFEPEADEEMAELVKNAVKKLEETQNPDGSWSRAGRGYPEIGVTAMTYLALRVAYSTGITGRETLSLDKIEKFIKKHRADRISTEGHALYGLSAYLRLAYGLGQKHNHEIQELTKQMLKYKFQDRMSEWDYLAAFFSTGALIHDRESKNWQQWFKYIRDHLIKIQKPEGCWIVEYCLHCKVFATTMALLSLLTPYDSFPLVQY